MFCKGARDGALDSTCEAILLGLADGDGGGTVPPSLGPTDGGAIGDDILTGAAVGTSFGMTSPDASVGPEVC